MKSALITGISGQDGSYLAELLLAKGYLVFGTRRPNAAGDQWRIRHLLDRITILEADLRDEASLEAAIRQAKPSEVYNLAAQSFIPASWKDPVSTAELNALGVARMLEGIRRIDPSIRFYQASTSEMFGAITESPQSESTHFRPQTPYGTAKTYGHLLTSNYRETHGLFACSGILFNHESPRRGGEFVTRKVTKAVAAIRAGTQERLRLGNCDSKRDWGYAGDYVEAMWQMLQQDEPEDFVIATGRTHRVADFVEKAFSHAGLDWQEHVETDEALVRPAEPHLVVGDPSKALAKLGWQAKVDLDGLVKIMVDADLARAGVIEVTAEADASIRGATANA